MWPIKMQFILCIWISAIHTISERIWNQEKNIWIYMWYCWYNIFRISKEVWTYGPIGPILSQTFFNGYRYLFAVIKMVFYSNTTWVVTCFNMSHSHVYILTFSHGRAIEGYLKYLIHFKWVWAMTNFSLALPHQLRSNFQQFP